MPRRLTFFTAANRGYEPFVLPYICSALSFNEDARVEICLEQPRRFEIENPDAMELLSEHFGDRFMFRRAIFDRRTPPNSVRFLETPAKTTEFTYIGDIDILILEEVTEPHIAHLKRTRLPYSNILRRNSAAPRLTGLHFTRSDAFYPIVLPADVDQYRGLDETLLAKLVAEKGHPLPDPADTFRPIHGIHISPNRRPAAAEPIGWSLLESRIAAYLTLRDSAVWSDLLPLFSERYRALLLLVEGVLQAKFPDQFSAQLLPRDVWAHGRR